MKNKIILKLTKLKKYPLIIVFVAFIAVVSIVNVFVPDKSFSDLENRFLAERPEFTLKGFLDSSFSKKYETYTNEQFVSRDLWITTKSLTESVLGKSENNGIVFGKDNYMFEKYIKYNKEQFDKNVGFVNAFAQNNNANTYFGIIPNSYTALSDKIPAGLPNLDQMEVIEGAYKNIENATAIDFYTPLKQNENEYIFYKTDHHWTTTGAYYAYEEFCDVIGTQPIDLGGLNKNQVYDFYGTYFSKSKRHNAKSDTITYYEIPITSFEVEDKKYDTLYDIKQFEKRDKYAAFLYNNNPLTVIRSDLTKNETPKKLLLIKDSYANSFAPYLAYNYDEIYIVDLRYFSAKMSEFIADNDFDDILVMYNFMNFSSDTNIFKLSQ